MSAMLQNSLVSDRQPTPWFRLMRDAAEAIGESHRFRMRDLAMSFNDQWNPKLEDSTMIAIP